MTWTQCEQFRTIVGQWHTVIFCKYGTQKVVMNRDG